MIIYLVGMMGAGKSTFGKQLAAYLNYEFVDLDDAIVAHEGKSIEQIFAESGENSFRLAEQNALHRETNAGENKVIATGGGAPCFFDNMDYMNSNGCTIFLNIAPKEIAKRLSKSNNAHRPLLLNKSAEEIEIFISDKLKERIMFYEESEVEILDSEVNMDWLLGLIL